MRRSSKRQIDEWLSASNPLIWPCPEVRDSVTRNRKVVVCNRKRFACQSVASPRCRSMSEDGRFLEASKDTEAGKRLASFMRPAKPGQRSHRKSKKQETRERRFLGFYHRIVQ